MSVTKLTETLEQLLLVHDRLNELAKQKTECLTKADVSALKLFIQKESVLIKQLQVLEKDRIKTVHQLAMSEGYNFKTMTITEVMSHLPPNQQSDIEQFQKQLLKAISTLKQQNELNQKLIEDSIRFVNMSLDIIQPEQESGNYDRPTATNNEPNFGRSLFDSKA
ncbi:MAG: flagellar protein FlgN [Bacillaceae bacterium]|nr:flagellar protein FlgN [Bacillaceae bacterium]